MKRATELIMQGGLSDKNIADQLGLPGDAGRVLVHRHRHAHVEAPARALAAAANRGRDNVQRREEVVAAAERGDPLDSLKVEKVIGDIRRVDQRLETSAEAASEAGQHTAVATLSGAQLRSAEVKLKASGVGGYSGTKIGIGIGIGGKPFEPFVLRLDLGEGQARTIIAAPWDAPPFEARYTDGRPFDPRDTTTTEIVIAPRSHPTNAPVIDHDPMAAAPEGTKMSEEELDRMVCAAQQNSGAPDKPVVENTSLPDAPEEEPDRDDPDLRKLGRAFGHS